ncbi:MAG: DUF1428 domain-containing protein [Pseudomonadota bacterium]
MNYIDGFVFPIPRDRLQDYRQMAKAVAEIWTEYGALAYQEYVGDDMTLNGTRSFTELVSAKADEAVVFGWVVFESRAARDEANRNVATDPRVADLMASSDSGFDASRMVYGGFETLVQLIKDGRD